MTMLKTSLTVLLLAALAVPALATNAPVVPANPLAVSDLERAKIEGVVRDLFMREPNIVMDAAQRFQQKQQEDQMKAASVSIKENGKLLYEDPGSPVGGNPKGDVTIVEFFDFNCGYCKHVHETTQKLKEEDKNIRYVYKQYPILGPGSLIASQAVMAANLQGKYVELHNALMTSKVKLDEASILQLAGTIKGLDVAKMKTDMNGDVVKKQIEADLTLGRKIGVQGTPGFVIADKLYPGAAQLEQFKQFVAEARAAKK